MNILGLLVYAYQFLSRKFKQVLLPLEAYKSCIDFAFGKIILYYPVLNYHQFDNEAVLVKSSLASYEDFLE